jgi:uncharacterized protein (TIGR04222 family)
MTPDPFDWNGPAFLVLYAALFVGAWVASRVAASSRRPEGGTRGTDDPDALAYLGGGAVRYAEALVARLLARRALSMSSPKTFAAIQREGGSTAAESAVLKLSTSVDWAAISRTAQSYAEPLERDLERRGLLMTRAETATLRWWTALPFITIFGLGIVKLAIGISRDKPVGFLTVFLVVTAVAIALALFSGDRRTRAGVRMVGDAREKLRRLKSAPTREEMGLAVALFGTGVLAASAYSDFHDLRRSSGDGGGGDGGCGSDGGSGCGGGGCGGCGS